MSNRMENWLPRHRITVDEYYRMVEVGLLAEDARVELIEGEIIDMAPIGSPHGSVVDKLNLLLVRAVGHRAIVRIQGAVRLSRSSQPQPDVALLKLSSDFYSRNHPTASDTLLIIEVSDTTLRYDREIKLPLYARHAVPEVWIVDLPEKRMHCFRSPALGEYTKVSMIGEPGMTPISALPGLVVDLSGLLRMTSSE